MYTNGLKHPNENVLSEVIELSVSAESGIAVSDKMNKEYKNIKLMTITPVKGEEGKFDVRIEIYNPEVWMAAPKEGFWPIKRKSKRSHTPTI